jgi:hypothetical protein
MLNQRLLNDKYTSCDIRHPCIELAANAKRLFEPAIVSLSQIGEDK